MQIALASASSTPGNSSNPYFIAFIAVIGTMIGATIAAITQTITTRRSSQEQLISLKLQMEHQTQESIRQDRRRAYVRYLQAMYQWEISALYIYGRSRRERKKVRPSDYVKYWEEYQDSLTEITLLASDRVSRLAHRIMENCRDDVKMALRGESPDRGNPEGEFPITLIAAMQEDLGVAGGIFLDEIGLRSQMDTTRDSRPLST